MRLSARYVPYPLPQKGGVDGRRGRIHTVLQTYGKGERAEKTCPIPPETRLFSSNVVVVVVVDVVRRNSEFNVSRREQHAPREDGNASQHGLHFTL